MADGRWRLSVRTVVGLIGVGVVLATVLSLSGAWLGRQLLFDPASRSALIAGVFGERGVSVDFRTIELARAAEWQVVLSDVSVETGATTVTAERARCGVPGFWSMWLGRVDLGEVEVDGLHVTVSERRAGGREGRLPLRLVVDRLKVRDGVLHLPAGDATPEVRVVGLATDLFDVRVVGGTGVVAGRGSVSAKSWQTGRVELERVAFDDVRLSRHVHQLGDGRLRVADGSATGRVSVEMGQGRRPRTTAELRIRDGDIATLVASMTGEPSPLTGRLAGEFSLEAGGEKSPGDVRIGADVALSEGTLRLGETTPPVLKAALKVAPFIQVRDGHVLLGPVRAVLQMSGGVVDVEELVHQGRGRPLVGRGRIEGGVLALVLRLVPKRRADTRAGIGLVVDGPAEALSVRRATSDELAGLGGVP